jgi:hypothetical protein
VPEAAGRAVLDPVEILFRSTLGELQPGNSEF